VLLALRPFTRPQQSDSIARQSEIRSYGIVPGNRSISQRLRIDFQLTSARSPGDDRSALTVCGDSYGLSVGTVTVTPPPASAWAAHKKAARGGDRRPGPSVARKTRQTHPA
jgi:hypothetical protein